MSKDWLVLLVVFVITSCCAVFPLLTENAALPRDAKPASRASLAGMKEAVFSALPSCGNATLIRSRKTFVILVDALRPDMLHDRELFPKISERWLRKSCVSATPRTGIPTVTLPRLKVILTGEEGGFADVVWNMFPHGGDSTLLTAVDLAAQRWSRRFAFYGDDTWTRVVNISSLARTGLVYSFDVHDTEAVDATVTQWLMDELREHRFGKLGDLDVLIAHFLGVDHVGHLFHPRSRAMREKLQQMDLTVNSLITAACSVSERDVSVVLLSDHGMAENGGHGGGTELERLTVLEYIPCESLHDGKECGGGDEGSWEQEDVAAFLAVLFQGHTTMSQVTNPSEIFPPNCRGVVHHPQRLFDGCAGGAHAAWVGTLNLAHLAGDEGLARSAELLRMSTSLDAYTNSVVRESEIWKLRFREARPRSAALFSIACVCICTMMLILWHLQRTVCVLTLLQAALMCSTSFMEDEHVTTCFSFIAQLLVSLAVNSKGAFAPLISAASVLVTGRAFLGGSLFDTGNKWTGGATAHTFLTSLTPLETAKSTVMRAAPGASGCIAAVAVFLTFRSTPASHLVALFMALALVPVGAHLFFVVAYIFWLIGLNKVRPRLNLSAEVALLDAATFAFGGSLKVADVEFSHVAVGPIIVTCIFAFAWRYLGVLLVVVYRRPNSVVLFQWCARRTVLLAVCCLVALVLRGHLFYWSVVLPKLLLLFMSCCFSFAVSGVVMTIAHVF